MTPAEATRPKAAAVQRALEQEDLAPILTAAAAE